MDYDDALEVYVGKVAQVLEDCMLNEDKKNMLHVKTMADSLEVSHPRLDVMDALQVILTHEKVPHQCGVGARDGGGSQRVFVIYKKDIAAFLNAMTEWQSATRVIFANFQGTR